MRTCALSDDNSVKVTKGSLNILEGPGCLTYVSWFNAEVLPG